MKTRILLLLLLAFSLTTQATNIKPIAIKDSIAKDSVDTESAMVYWARKNTIGANLNEVAFVNWNAGGNNSISALFYADIKRDYKSAHTTWKNSISIKYGLNAQEGREMRKTNDELRLKTSFGYKKDSTSNWYYSGRFSFNTQFSNGYKYPDNDVPISQFMAPGYTFLGGGSEYSHPELDFNVYTSPVTMKSTFVLDQALANEGMFGVTPAKKNDEGEILEKGENVHTEFGFLVTSGFSKEVFENVNFSNQLSLYSDYLNKFGNIDVDWQVDVNLKVNDFIKANVGSHLIYDDDVKFKEDTNNDGKLETSGPRIQIKQMLGVGVIYEF